MANSKVMMSVCCHSTQRGKTLVVAYKACNGRRSTCTANIITFEDGAGLQHSKKHMAACFKRRQRRVVKALANFEKAQMAKAANQQLGSMTRVYLYLVTVANIQLRVEGEGSRVLAPLGVPGVPASRPESSTAHQGIVDVTDHLQQKYPCPPCLMQTAGA